MAASVWQIGQQIPSEFGARSAPHGEGDAALDGQVPACGMDRRRLSIGLMLNVAVIAFEALSVATIAPRVARDLDGIELYGWLFAAFMLANLISVVVAGHASDRFGPAPPFAIGLVLFTAGLLLGGLAPTMPVLVIGRAVQGLGAGALLSTAYVAIGRAYDESERPRQFALLSTAWVVPGLIAPGLAGVIAQQFGWRFVFLGLAVLPLIAGWLCFPAMRRLGPTATHDGSALPIGAAIRLAVGAGLVIGGLSADSVLLGGIAVVAGVVVGIPAFLRLTPPGTIRARPGLPAAVASRGLLTFAFFGADAFLALALARVRGLSPVEVGIVLTPATLTWTAGSWIQARRAGITSRRTLVTVGTAIVAVGLAIGATVLVPGVPVWIAGVAWGIAGLGIGVAYSTTSLVVLSEADDGGQGVATSALQVSDVLGTALGTGIGGAIVAVAASSGWARREGLGVVFALMVAVACVSIVTARRFPRDPAPRSDETATPPALRSDHDDNLP
jgi:MFS family permease